MIIPWIAANVAAVISSLTQPRREQGEPYIGEILYAWPDGGHITRIHTDQQLLVDGLSLPASLEIDYDTEIAFCYRDFSGSHLVMVCLKTTLGLVLLCVRSSSDHEPPLIAEQRLSAFFVALSQVTSILNYNISPLLVVETTKTESGRRDLVQGTWLTAPDRAVA